MSSLCLSRCSLEPKLCYFPALFNGNRDNRDSCPKTDYCFHRAYVDAYDLWELATLRWPRGPPIPWPRPTVHFADPVATDASWEQTDPNLLQITPWMPLVSPWIPWD